MHPRALRRFAPLLVLLACAGAGLTAARAADAANAQAAEKAPDAGAAQPPPPAASEPAFGFEDVVARAKALAAEPFEPPPQVPKFLRQLSPEQWRGIAYRPEKALWGDQGLPFAVQLFHPGSYYQHAVAIRVISEYGVGRLTFEKERFDYPSEKMRKRVPADLGYAGFRIHYPINRPDQKTEMAVFLGASYFRAVGAGAVYGQSARGLAIDTGLPGGEEFPYFKAFWLRHPAPDAKAMTVYALLDSASVTGAYRFVINPGATTVMDVQLRLFTRKDIAKLGIAPLTSMFLFSETLNKPVADYRPEVHDSDGLMMAAGSGEWLWRPLVNPDTLTINSFAFDRINGFGLLQRDRVFAHYQDLLRRYEQRPGTWVVPQGDWGPGHVELVQIPSASSRNDNIVAYWVADKPVKAGQTLDYAYRLSWEMREPTRPPSGYTVATRVGAPESAEATPPAVREVVVDFAGEGLAELGADQDLTARVTVDAAGKLVDARVMRNDVAGGWRLFCRLQYGNPDAPLEVRAYLANAQGGALTETWTYAVPPP